VVFILILVIVTMMTKKSPKITKEYYCSACDYLCFRQSEYTRHLSRRKHEMMTNSDKMMTKNHQKSPDRYQCECGQVYQYRQGLSLHKKKCQKSPKDEELEKLKEENREIKQLLVEVVNGQNQMQNSFVELIKKDTTSHSHNTTNSHNKTFNLQFFLNDTCKDAMNIGDFIKTLQIDTSDVEKMGEVGYADGISRLLINGLNELDITQRPIHCSDLKREIIHIKDQDRWEKDTPNQDRLKNVIQKITNKNIMLLDDWKRLHPGCTEYDNRKNDLYLKIMVESMGPVDETTATRDFKKIIKKVAVSTIIDKSM